MRRSRISYLESKPSGFYFRFQIPSQFRLIAGRSCVRVSLHTGDRGIARERIATVLPHVYSLRRLFRKSHKMTTDEHRRALSFAVKRARLHMLTLAYRCSSSVALNPSACRYDIRCMRARLDRSTD
jgi:hypothetical protein